MKTTVNLIEKTILMNGVNLMLKIKHQFQSFEEYLGYSDNSEKFYELFNGKLIETSP